MGGILFLIPSGVDFELQSCRLPMPLPTISDADSPGGPVPPPGPLRPSSGPKWAKKGRLWGGALRGGGVHFTKEKNHKNFLGQIFPWTPGPKIRLGVGALAGEFGIWYFSMNETRDTGLASWGPRDEKERARKTKAKKKGVWGGEIM